MSGFTTLREANAVRELEWDSGGKLDGSFYGVEMAGEVGEAIEAAIGASKDMDGHVYLADELADVVICVNLVARKLDIEVPDKIDLTGEFVSDVGEELLRLAMFSGRACNLIKKLERERLGLAGSRATKDELANELSLVLFVTHLIAWAFAVRLDVAVAVKFNKTSEKVGLKTMMAVPA